MSNIVRPTVRSQQGEVHSKGKSGPPVSSARKGALGMALLILGREGVHGLYCGLSVGVMRHVLYTGGFHPFETPDTAAMPSADAFFFVKFDRFVLYTPFRTFYRTTVLGNPAGNVQIVHPSSHSVYVKRI